MAAGFVTYLACDDSGFDVGSSSGGAASSAANGAGSESVSALTDAFESLEVEDEPSEGMQDTIMTAMRADGSFVLVPSLHHRPLCQ